MASPALTAWARPRAWVRAEVHMAGKMRGAKKPSRATLRARMGTVSATQLGWRGGLEA